MVATFLQADKIPYWLNSTKIHLKWHVGNFWEFLGRSKNPRVDESHTLQYMGFFKIGLTNFGNNKNVTLYFSIHFELGHDHYWLSKLSWPICQALVLQEFEWTKEWEGRRWHEVRHIQSQLQNFRKKWIMITNHMVTIPTKTRSPHDFHLKSTMTITSPIIGKQNYMGLAFITCGLSQKITP